MRFVLFVHSLFSDWNHGNAHFLRGVARALTAQGHEVRVFEPADGWSLCNLLSEPDGPALLAEIRTAFPGMSSTAYRASGPDLDATLDGALDGADVVIVHEWNPPDLVARIGRARARGGRFRLLFHDTHHRSVTRPDEMAAYDLSAFDGVLAFGEAVAERYRAMGWSRRVWVWHEAADVALFRPIPGMAAAGDLAWVGNWGDGERTAELDEFLLKPVADLGLSATVHGVRYPEEGRRALAAAGIDHRGWLPNHRVPEVFARHRVTIHVPRRPYAHALPGVPTIRMFEALACGIPIVSAPWDDSEGLFTPGSDYRVARSGAEMASSLRALLADPVEAAAMARRGRETILARHTCGHRAEQLAGICAELDAPGVQRPLAEAS